MHHHSVGKKRGVTHWSHQRLISEEAEIWLFYSFAGGGYLFWWSKATWHKPLRQLQHLLNRDVSFYIGVFILAPPKCITLTVEKSHNTHNFVSFETTSALPFSADLSVGECFVSLNLFGSLMNCRHKSRPRGC